MAALTRGIRDAQTHPSALDVKQISSNFLFRRMPIRNQGINPVAMVLTRIGSHSRIKISRIRARFFGEGRLSTPSII
jgi:hypothetical protein